MEALYVIEPGSYLKKDGATLKIVKQNQVVAEVPAQGLKRLTLVGYASLSGGVLEFLIRHRIETVFITPTGKFRARLMLDEHAHVSRRLAQYRCLENKLFAMELARTLVRGKLENQVRYLLRRARDYKIAELKAAAARIRAVHRSLDRAKDLDVIRGIEGYGTRLYYEAFPFLLRQGEFPFSGRNRRPPRDPVNAMLSFVYTMLTNEVLGALKSAGLDPYLGALHEVARGRPSLACDLVEEWRVLGERLVIALVNRRVVRPDDFVVRLRDLPESHPQRLRSVEMKPAALRALIKSYEKQMERRCPNPATDDQRTYRWAIHAQVRRLARSLEEGKPDYETFRFED